MSAEPPAFPKALDDDDDDVAWALQTAAVQWERGGHADAVVWLRRAAQAAVESGEFGRAADLERGAREVESWVERGVVGPAPDEDDGVDALLEGPTIEAGSFEGPSQSLVDALEAESRDEMPSTESLLDSDIEDLGDVQDVEDIEAIAPDDLDERTSTPPEEADRPSVAPMPLVKPSKRPRARSIQTSEAPDAPTLKPPVGEKKFKLPPPPIPRLPLPLPVPRPSTPKPPPPEALSEPPVQLAEPPELEDEPSTTPISHPPPAPPPLDPADAPPPFEAHDAPPSSSQVLPPPLEPPARSAPRSLAPEAPGDLAGDLPRLPPRDAMPSADLDPELASGEIELPPMDSVPPPRVVEIAGPAVAPSGGALAPERLASVRGLEDLPPETQAELASRASVETLAPEQEVSGFGLALVTRGAVFVMPTIAEGACGRAVAGEPVFAQGNLAEGVPLRAVADTEGAEVAVWQRADFEHLLETCPWVAEELRAVGDRYQALAGAAMGPLGERLDDGMRAMITDRAEVKYLEPGEQVLAQGEKVAGLSIVGAGALELVVDGEVRGQLHPGDLPFASGVLSHEKAAGALRAGAQGALVLSVDRMTTHELLVSVPPLLELLATS
jgi:hypothetical protein